MVIHPAGEHRAERFDPGDPVVLRSVNWFAGHGEAVGHAVAGRVIADDTEMAVVATPLLSEVRRRAGAGSGPNRRLVLPEDWDGSYREEQWTGASVVRVHRWGENWSVWRWHDGTTWQPHWYINLELPWVRTRLGFDSQDWTLDVVAATDGDGAWRVWFKDEDELEFYAGTGHWTTEMRTVIEQAGRDAASVARARTFPFDADWSGWVPDPEWEAERLPGGWNVLDATGRS
jgi:hypothetical protein